MTRELKVCNQFREVILRIHLTYGDAPELLTIDATEEMRSAIRSLIGQDFDRTVGRGDKLLRFTARWGSPEYAQVLADYFWNNFGWSTSLVEREQPSSVGTQTAVGELFARTPGSFRAGVKGRAAQAGENAMAAAAGAGTNGLSYTGGESVYCDGQLGSGHLFNPLVADIASRQSA